MSVSKVSLCGLAVSTVLVAGSACFLRGAYREYREMGEAIERAGKVLNMLQEDAQELAEFMNRMTLATRKKCALTREDEQKFYELFLHEYDTNDPQPRQEKRGGNE